MRAGRDLEDHLAGNHAKVVPDVGQDLAHLVMTGVGELRCFPVMQRRAAVFLLEQQARARLGKICETREGRVGKSNFGGVSPASVRQSNLGTVRAGRRKLRRRKDPVGILERPAGDQAQRAGYAPCAVAQQIDQRMISDNVSGMLADIEQCPVDIEEQGGRFRFRFFWRLQHPRTVTNPVLP